jgi:hypothetical protein
VKNTKKILFNISLSGTVLIVLLFILSTSICYHNSLCNMVEDSIPNNDNLQIIFILPFLFLFSLITYKMREEVFRAWWGFARWWAPIIVVITLLLNNAGGGGTIGMDGSFYFFILDVLYGVLVIVSIVKIWRAYRHK